MLTSRKSIFVPGDGTRLAFLSCQTSQRSAGRPTRPVTAFGIEAFSPLACISTWGPGRPAPLYRREPVTEVSALSFSLFAFRFALAVSRSPPLFAVTRAAPSGTICSRHSPARSPSAVSVFCSPVFAVSSCIRALCAPSRASPELSPVAPGVFFDAFASPVYHHRLCTGSGPPPHFARACALRACARGGSEAPRC